MKSLPEGFVNPVYDGGSIANVPGTVAALLGVPFSGLAPVGEELWRPLGRDVRRVVTLLIDAMGWNLIEQEMETLRPILAQATAVGRLTSIFPSTTVAALSSLWTGAAPIQHGLVGLRLFLPEFGAVGQFLSFSPTLGKFPNALVDAGLDPETFLQWPGMAQQLATAGIATHAFRGYEIANSTLSRMHGRGTAVEHSAITFGDMLVQMRHLLEQQAGEPLHVSAYWPTIDTLSHIYGWPAEAVAVELRSLIAQVQREFLEALSPAARKGTVLLILADHGQVIAPWDGHIFLEDYPELRDMLFMGPTGEPRVAYLYARHGARDSLVAGLNESLGGALVAWTAEEAVAAGLFGPPPYSAEGVQRLGDVVVAMRDGYTLYDGRRRDQSSARRMIGRHGSLTGAEMSVPWIALRLD